MKLLNTIAAVAAICLSVMTGALAEAPAAELPLLATVHARSFPGPVTIGYARYEASNENQQYDPIYALRWNDYFQKPVQTLKIEEAGYNGAFTESDTCAGQVISDVAGSTLLLSRAAHAAGWCTATITGAAGMSATLDLYVGTRDRDWDGRFAPHVSIFDGGVTMTRIVDHMDVDSEIGVSTVPPPDRNTIGPSITYADGEWAPTIAALRWFTELQWSPHSQDLNIVEPGYGGKFTETDDCDGMVKVALKGSTLSVEREAGRTGWCSVTAIDAAGTSATVKLYDGRDGRSWEHLYPAPLR